MEIIGITGGKGGTGKSTVSAAIASGLARRHKVLLVDADADCPNDHLILGIKREILKTVSQRIPVWDREKCVKCGRCANVCKTKAVFFVPGKFPVFIKEQCNGCGACVLKCSNRSIGWSKKDIGKIYSGKKGNIRLLSGDLKAGEPVSEFIVNALNEIVGREMNSYDYVIIDTAAGIHCPVIAALKNCRRILAVAEPTPLGEHDLDLILKLAEKLDIDSSVILNRSDIGAREGIYNISKKHGSRVVAEIPYSKDVIRQYSAGNLDGRKSIFKPLEKYLF